MSCEPCKQNPGERLRQETLDRQAGRACAFADFGPGSTLPDQNMVGVLEVVSDAVERGASDSSEDDTETAIETLREHAGDLHIVTRLLPEEAFQQWLHAKTLLFSPTRDDANGGEKLDVWQQGGRGSGTLWFFTNLVHPQADNVLANFLRKVSSYSYRDLLVGKDGLNLERMGRINKEEDDRYAEFLIGYWMQVLQMHRESTPVKKVRIRKPSLKKNPGETGPDESLDMAGGRYCADYYQGRWEEEDIAKHIPMLEVMSDAVQEGDLVYADELIDELLANEKHAATAMGDAKEIWTDSSWALVYDGRVRDTHSEADYDTTSEYMRSATNNIAKGAWSLSCVMADRIIQMSKAHTVDGRGTKQFYWCDLFAHPDSDIALRAEIDMPAFRRGFWMEVVAIFTRGQQRGRHGQPGKMAPKGNPALNRAVMDREAFVAGNSYARETVNAEFDLTRDQMNELEVAFDALEEGQRSKAFVIFDVMRDGETGKYMSVPMIHRRFYTKDRDAFVTGYWVGRYQQMCYLEGDVERGDELEMRFEKVIKMPPEQKKKRNPAENISHLYIMGVDEGVRRAVDFPVELTPEMRDELDVAFDALENGERRRAFLIFDALNDLTVHGNHRKSDLAWKRYQAEFRPSDPGWGRLANALDHDSFMVGFWTGQYIMWLESVKRPWDASKLRSRIDDLIEMPPDAKKNPSVIPPEARKAAKMYELFWKLDPTDIGEFHSSFKIPAKVALVGAAKWITYSSGKKDPETLKLPKKPVDYIHTFDAGVQLYAMGERGDQNVPAEVVAATALTLLGVCLGWQVVQDGKKREAEATAPMPELYTIPSGRALLVIQDKREILAIFWGGQLGVEGRGIVH